MVDDEELTDAQFEKLLARQRKMSRAGEDLLTQREFRKATESQSYAKITAAELEHGKFSPKKITSIASATQVGLQTASFFKPMIIGVLVLFIFIGPGTAAILQLVGAMPWYLWLALIFLGLQIWRNN